MKNMKVYSSIPAYQAKKVPNQIFHYLLRNAGIIHKGTTYKTIIKLAYFIILILSCFGPQKLELFAQTLFQFRGTVVDASTNKPLEFATVAIIELKRKSYTNAKGKFSLTIPKAGNYTIVIQSSGLATLQQKLELAATFNKVFRLEPRRVRGNGLDIAAERDIQKLSRNTLDQQDLKDAPATFGDSLNALATLPGVLRSNGFFGSLIVRGANQYSNRYFIDDVPIPNPQHFGAIQSVISNDLIDRIDLYSSSFPASYGGALGAVIDIHTIDNIKKELRVLDVSIISSNIFWARPWSGVDLSRRLIERNGQNREKNSVNRDNKDSLSAIDNLRKTGKKKDVNRLSANTGYVIAAGRVSYLTLLVPPIYKLITGEELIQLPEYYDYQVKTKFFLGSSGRHAISLLFFGSYDTFKFVQNLDEKEQEEAREEGADPLLDRSNGKSQTSSHSQSIKYHYRSSSQLNNHLVFYNIFTESVFALQSESALEYGYDRGSDLATRPNIAGIKNRLIREYVPNRAEIEISVEYQFYYFQSRGETTILTRPYYADAGPPDFTDDSLFAKANVDNNIINQLINFYLVHKVTWKGLKIIPGIRSEYLMLNKDAIFDPRILLSYTFSSDTTISLGAGHYSSFPQVNQFYFNQLFSQQPQISVADYLKPERAFHRSLGISQDWQLYTVKIEGFYNSFYNLVENVPDDSRERYFDNTGRAESYGFEVFMRKNRLAGVNGLYFWISYTYTNAEFKSGNPLNPYQGTYYPFEYEQPHNLKLTAGYILGRHQIGARFEFYSGFPYTPIIGSRANSDVPGRYSPEYGVPYSQRFSFAHRLDLRYSQTISFSSSILKWYIEVINIYNFKPESSLDWDYGKPYSPGENPTIGSGGTLTLIPNFGLEYRF